MLCFKSFKKFTLLLAAFFSIFAAPLLGKELRIGVQAITSSLDPHYHNTGTNNQVTRHVFDKLVERDENQQPAPGLAESWRAIDDLTWEFKLRKGVQWQDGSAFTADDVVFTFDRAPDVENSPGSFAQYLKGKKVIKVNDLIVNIKTEKPYPLMPNDLMTFGIISKKHGQGAKTEDYNSKKALVGTGPYQVEEFRFGDRVVLKANPLYWGTKPMWDRVIMKVYKSGPSRVAALLSGDVDLIEHVPTTDIERLKNDSNITLSEGASARLIYMHLDRWQENSKEFTDKATGQPLGNNPFNDLRVRQAFSFAISREAIGSRIMDDLSIPAGQIVPEGLFGYDPSLKAWPYDPKKAKDLMVEAGYADGFGIVVHAPNNRYVNDYKIAEAIAQMLTRIGIKVSVETEPKTTYFKNAWNYSFLLAGWGSNSGEASSALRAIVSTQDKKKGTGTNNRGRYSNTEVDQAIEQALATIDDTDRLHLLQKATRIAVEDVAIIPVHFQKGVWAAKKGLYYKTRVDQHTIATGVYTK
ncbi:ABC transporter substrate-binding protein [bacterium]|nr:ABC transporter substrate-binding protein [bacterium]